MSDGGLVLAGVAVGAAATVGGQLVTTLDAARLDRRRSEREERHRKRALIVELVGIVDDQFQHIRRVSDAGTPAEGMDRLVEHRSQVVRRTTDAQIGAGPKVQAALKEIFTVQQATLNVLGNALFTNRRPSQSDWAALDNQLSAANASLIGAASEELAPARRYSWSRGVRRDLTIF